MNLWENYQQMLEVEMPRVEMVGEVGEEDEEGEYERVRRMVEMEMGGAGEEEI